MTTHFLRDPYFLLFLPLLSRPCSSTPFYLILIFNIFLLLCSLYPVFVSSVSHLYFCSSYSSAVSYFFFSLFAILRIFSSRLSSFLISFLLIFPCSFLLLFPSVPVLFIFHMVALWDSYLILIQLFGVRLGPLGEGSAHRQNFLLQKKRYNPDYQFLSLFNVRRGTAEYFVPPS